MNRYFKKKNKARQEYAAIATDDFLSASVDLSFNADIWYFFTTENITRCLMNKLWLLPNKFSFFFRLFMIAIPDTPELSFLTVVFKRVATSAVGQCSLV